MITKRQLKRLIREEVACLVNEAALEDQIIPLVQAGQWDDAARAALDVMSFEHLQLELDDGDLKLALKDAALTPTVFRSYQSNLERAAWSLWSAQMDDAIAADPDKDWLEFMTQEFAATITPKDLETLGWKEYKRYVRLAPPQSISHSIGEIHITNDDIEHYAPGGREEFVDFLTRRAPKGGLKKRKIYRSPPPMYD